MKHANIAIFVPHSGCPHRCSFCDQHSISSTVSVPDGDFVRRECERALENFSGNLQNAQIAFFGGSFTAIDRNLMVELLSAANDYIGEGAFSSVRISTRPDCIDEEILTLLKSYHVTAIELGAQSMNDTVLQKNHRGHTAEDVRKASAIIRAHGFELGLQMMVGLMGETATDAVYTAEQLADLHPETVRIYPTIVLKNTALAAQYALGKYQPLDVDEAVDICAKLLDFFETQHIRVIRLGLHDSETLLENRVAGPYHPAFRELCQARRLLHRVLEQLSTLPKGMYTIYVNDRKLSQFHGQKKQNIDILKTHGYSVTFCGDSRVNNENFVLKGERNGTDQSVKIVGNTGI